MTAGLIYRLELWLIVSLLLLGGMFVVSGSPHFFALAARYCRPEYTAEALTVQNGIGFAFTTIPIGLPPRLANFVTWQWDFTVLGADPLVGIYFVRLLPETGAPKKDGPPGHDMGA